MLTSNATLVGRGNKGREPTLTTHAVQNSLYHCWKSSLADLEGPVVILLAIYLELPWCSLLMLHYVHAVTSMTGLDHSLKRKDIGEMMRYTRRQKCSKCSAIYMYTSVDGLGEYQYCFKFTMYILTLIYQRGVVTNHLSIFSGKLKGLFLPLNSCI